MIQSSQLATAPVGDAGATDGWLLERFIDHGDGDAFEGIVRRHGPMVLGLCRRVLRNADDADDAFQATFLVLARKAASVRPRERVGSFLYGVAYRCALDARAAIMRRRLKESRAMPRPDVTPDGPAHELRALLDREVNRLPEKYRLPVVLCDLEGKTRTQAAGQLGWAEGTVAGRLARARALLAHRLTRRGVTVSAVALALLLVQQAPAVSVPAPLAASAVKAAMLVAAGHATVVGVISAKAATLAQGALKALLLAKLKAATAILLAVTVVGGSVAYVSRPLPKDLPAADLPLRRGLAGQE